MAINVRPERRARELSQEELAYRAGLSALDPTPLIGQRNK
jgi:transcriptional regulator with XRE-family HTH domain